MNTKFTVCLNNTGYEPAVETGKLYEVVADPEAGKDHMIRVIDEGGEDYLFHPNISYPLIIPAESVTGVHEPV